MIMVIGHEKMEKSIVRGENRLKRFGALIKTLEATISAYRGRIDVLENVRVASHFTHVPLINELMIHFFCHDVIHS